MKANLPPGEHLQAFLSVKTALDQGQIRTKTLLPLLLRALLASDEESGPNEPQGLAFCALLRAYNALLDAKAQEQEPQGDPIPTGPLATRETERAWNQKCASILGLADTDNEANLHACYIPALQTVYEQELSLPPLLLSYLARAYCVWEAKRSEARAAFWKQEFNAHHGHDPVPSAQEPITEAKEPA